MYHCVHGPRSKARVRQNRGRLLVHEYDSGGIKIRANGREFEFKKVVRLEGIEPPYLAVRRSQQRCSEGLFSIPAGPV